MYNPYRINSYKLRKLAALNTLYKLAGKSGQATFSFGLPRAEDPFLTRDKTLYNLVVQSRTAQPPESINQHLVNAAKEINARQPANPLIDTKTNKLMNPRKTPKQWDPHDPKPKGKFRRGLEGAGKHIWKNKGAYGGGTVGTLGALAALYEGRQAHKSRKELARVLERLSASDRGLSAAQKRIKQLESRGFFDYLFGRNK